MGSDPLPKTWGPKRGPWLTPWSSHPISIHDLSKIKEGFNLQWLWSWADIKGCAWGPLFQGWASISAALPCCRWGQYQISSLCWASIQVSPSQGGWIWTTPSAMCCVPGPEAGGVFTSVSNWSGLLAGFSPGWAGFFLVSTLQHGPTKLIPLLWAIFRDARKRISHFCSWLWVCSKVKANWGVCEQV